MKKKTSRRKIILNIHKVLGLTTGIVLFIVSITGCCWVFKDVVEILYDDYKQVTPSESSIILPSKVKEIAEKVIPNKAIHGVVYGQPNEALEVIFYEAEPEFYQSVFLNPYSGNLIKTINHKSGFFSFILDGHLYLWLPSNIGSNIVSYSVLLFLIILISGVFLWWPKNKKGRKQRFTFKWSATTRWKRKNFDIHTILGFYIGSFSFILAFTGCIMAFNWFYFITYKITGGDKAPQFIIPNNISENNQSLKKNTLAIDNLLPLLNETYPAAKSFELHYPAADSSSILVEVSRKSSINYSMDYLFFDQNTLTELETPSIYGKYENATFADKIIRMNYDIHVGSIGGILGKTIAFLVSLVTATLPISGILLWYGKKFK